MTTKRFKGKTCAYCGEPNIATTGDHVFARGFLLVRRRANLPEVPACDSCNGEKSRLETYLMQIMPLGANHTEARETCNELMPKRARHPANKVLRQILDGPGSPVRLYDETGQVHERIPVYVDADKIQNWCGLVARGLAFHHWGVVTPEYLVETIPLTAETEANILNFAQRLKGGEYVERDVGGGAFVYRGFKCADGEAASMWIIYLYGRMPIGGDPTASPACAASWGVFITPKNRAPITVATAL